MTAGRGDDDAAVERRLHELILELAEPDAELSPATELSALEIDSLDLAEIAHVLAEEFGVELPTEQLERVATIGDLVAAVQARRGGAAPGGEAAG